MSTGNVPRQKHVPLRTCVICREKSPKRDLIRVVHADDGILIDPSGKINGRGAYLCGRDNCWERAVKSNVLNTALRTVLTDEDRRRLERARPSS